MKKAIVTLVIGKKYQSNFQMFCDVAWKQYASRIGADLIIISRPLDESERAQSRSPAWQKCLILSHEQVKSYDQVAWIDSDILINPSSPDLFTSVPLELVGAVDDFATPTKEEHDRALARAYDRWKLDGVKFIENRTAAEYHSLYGLQLDTESVVQTGVLVASPTYHRELFEHVYRTYDEKLGAEWNYEMRPLSYEIIKNNLHYWIDPKFNMPWSYIKQYNYPFLCYTPETIFDRAKELLCRYSFAKNQLPKLCATTAFLNNNFLHFAGCSAEMALVDQSCKSVFKLTR